MLLFDFSEKSLLSLVVFKKHFLPTRGGRNGGGGGGGGRGSGGRDAFTYTGNFVFYGLRPQTEYEVIIQSRNREGWSDPNDIYRFTTRSRGESKGI